LDFSVLSVYIAPLVNVGRVSSNIRIFSNV
jgi:hypothetical protein